MTFSRNARFVLPILMGAALCCSALAAAVKFVSTWPPDRKLVSLGTLTLTKTVKDQATAQKSIMFSPLNLAPGIEPSADPVLLVRPAAYGVSFSQRIQP